MADASASAAEGSSCTRPSTADAHAVSSAPDTPGSCHDERTAGRNWGGRSMNDDGKNGNGPPVPEWHVAGGTGSRGAYAYRPARVLVPRQWSRRDDGVDERRPRPADEVTAAGVSLGPTPNRLRSFVVLEGVADVTRTMAALRAEGVDARPDHVFFAVPAAASAGAPVMFSGVSGAPVMFSGVSGAPVMFSGVSGAPVMFSGGPRLRVLLRRALAADLARPAPGVHRPAGRCTDPRPARPARRCPGLPCRRGRHGPCGRRPRPRRSGRHRSNGGS